MIGVSQAVRVYARAHPTDLRKGYTGLAGLVMQEMGQDLLNGDLFLFVSKDRHSAKILHWDGTGVCIYSKRLAKGHFVAPWNRRQGGSVRLSMAELATFMEGVRPERHPTKKLSLLR